jgi:hypothetical protein
MAGATLTPNADGQTGILKLNLHDVTTGTLACPTIPAHALGSVLVGSYYLQGGSDPTFTVPMDDIADRTLSWSTPGPVTQSSGQLTVHIQAK